MLPDHRATYVRTILASLIATGAVVPVGVWARHLNLTSGVLPLIDSAGRRYWLVSIVLALILGAIFQLFDRSTALQAKAMTAQNSRLGTQVIIPIAWVLPLVASLTVSMLLAIYHSEAALVCSALGVFVVDAAGSISRYHLFDNEPGVVDRARSFHTVIIHVAAFFALAMIYVNKLPSRYTATAVFVAVLLLLMLLTEGEPIEFARRLLYSLAGGVMLAELTWILNYWAAGGWAGGAVLLVFFYLAAGLILAQVRQGVQPRDLLEYGGVSLAAFVIVMVSLFR